MLYVVHRFPFGIQSQLVWCRCGLPYNLNFLTSNYDFFLFLALCCSSKILNQRSSFLRNMEYCNLLNTKAMIETT